MPEGFAAAVEAACDRLDALMAGEPRAIIGFDRIRLAFVGLDVDHEHFRSIADEIGVQYGEPVIAALADALNEDANHFQVGYIVGQQLARALNGVYALGVLCGELHREQEVRTLRAELQRLRSER